MYNLIPLVKVNKVAGLIGYTLETKLGNEVLQVTDISMGQSARDGYQIAMRTLRLRQSGFSLDMAKAYAKEAQTNPKIGELALMHMHSEKEGMDFFEYIVLVASHGGKV